MADGITTLTNLELRAMLWERADYISYLERKLLQRRFYYPEPPPYELKSKSFYIEQVKALKESKK